MLFFFEEEQSDNGSATTSQRNSQKMQTEDIQIPCECGRFYIGETGVWFDERENQHKYAVKKYDSSNSFAAHIAETGH